MKMLTLPIKKKWLDMILSGEKKEEYREIKPYYESRFAKWFGVVMLGGNLLKASDIGLSKCEKDDIQEIQFRNGYNRKSPSFVAKCSLSVGTGKEKWGAEKDRQYFVLTIHEIIMTSMNLEDGNEGTDKSWMQEDVDNPSGFQTERKFLEKRKEPRYGQDKN